MKLLKIFLLLVTSDATHSIKIDCLFGITFDNLYTCTNLNLKVDVDNVQITDVNGMHWIGRSHESVTALYFLSSGMKRLPRGLYKIFKNVKRVAVHGLDTVGEFLDNNAITRGDFQGAKGVNALLFMSVMLEQLRARAFEGAENLNYLTIEACRVSVIDKDAFKGLKKLQSLGLKYNFITTLHPTTFNDLGQLEHLLLSGNYLRSLTKNHFKNLKKINRISLIGNLLTEIDPNLISQFKDLEYLYLDQNLCIDEHFGSDGAPFSKFPKLISACSKEASRDENLKKQAVEMVELENEVISLQHLVEKYKNTCGIQSMLMGNGLEDQMWMVRRREMP